jgi:RNA polymerase sigma-70 factor (ECF subfamily)
MVAEEPEESSLVHRARMGDPSAFEELVRRHEPLLLRTGRFLLRDAEAARDAAQEVFLRAWKALPGYEGRAPFRAWLLALLRHLCLDRARAERRRAEAIAGRPPQGGSASTTDHGLRQRDRENALEAALEPLSERQRLALVLMVREGMTAREVAGVLGCSETTARVTAFQARRRARKALARALEGKGATIRDAARWLL